MTEGTQLVADALLAGVLLAVVLSLFLARN